MTDALPPVSFSHIGVFAFDPEALVDFYVRTLGLHVTDRGEARGQKLIFLSRDTNEHHQIAIAGGRTDAAQETTVNQISFRLASLEALRAMARHLAAAGLELRPVNHGIAWSVYFHDPEGNRLEVFVDTPFYGDPYRADPLDLTITDDEVAAATEAMYGTDPTFTTRKAWQEAFGDKLTRG